MSDIIRLLPDSVANQIAAGEVIQRPASVIKELVENAVDAGATEIRIFIRDAGRTLIQVIDNGTGMSVTDVRMAFERHATSKISQASDLFSLRTMGFRGEALPSICAISQVEVKTRTDSDSIGTRLLINASHVESQEAVVCDRGTNIMVRNLFFNIPARRKFLKSDNVELANVMREFERLALVNNHIRMSIDRGGGHPLELRPGSFKQRIGELWKNNLNMQLLPVEVDTSLVKISGFVSRPEHARRRNALQYLIVNGRNMRHTYFHRGIVGCFENLIPVDSQPCYFLKFEVDPATIDVNIHPTKSEIKFEREQDIWKILTTSVRASLGKFAAVPSIDFTDEILPVEPLREGEVPEAPCVEVPGGYNPFERYFQPENAEKNEAVSYSGRHRAGNQWRPTSQSQNWETLYESFMKQGASTASATQSTGQLPVEEATEVPGAVCMQLSAKYILATSREGLLIIDQHRAHVRILFERLLAAGIKDESPSQQSLFPDTVCLDEAQRNALYEVRADLESFGFRLEEGTGGRWKITGIPSPLRDSDPGELIVSVLDSVCDESADYGSDGSPIRRLQERMALVMARGAAIRRGQRLSVTEMEHIVGELFSLSAPALTPDGNPVYRLLDDRQIEHLFS